MIVDADAARDALLVQYAMDMAKTGLFPALDPRITDWDLRGHILGTDTLRLMREDVCFGFLAESKASPGTFVVIIRGTDGVLEWIEDAEFLLTPYARGGNVEAGFWRVYKTMRYTAMGSGLFEPVAQGIAHGVGEGRVRVVGHSLGSALATYLTLDLAYLIAERVSGLFLASPRPGDATFAALFHSKVESYRLYNYELDFVPRIPRGFHFSQLPNVIAISTDISQARIKFGLFCNHHAICYASMLDFSLQDWARAKFDPSYLACILGPHLAHA